MIYQIITGSAVARANNLFLSPCAADASSWKFKTLYLIITPTPCVYVSGLCITGIRIGSPIHVQTMCAYIYVLCVLLCVLGVLYIIHEGISYVCTLFFFLSISISAR